MIDGAFENAIDRFIERFYYFNDITSKEELTMLRFENKNYYKEHTECAPGGGIGRKLCLYAIIESPEEGGVISFSHQGDKITPQVGSIIVFPSCALHPVKVSHVKSGKLTYLNTFFF